MGKSAFSSSSRNREKLTEMPHVPVMVEQVVDAFRLCPAGDFVDGTLGMGGHAEALLKAYPKATLLGIDLDEDGLKLAKEKLFRFGIRARLSQGSYTEMASLARREEVGPIVGIFLDLGVSSLQLDSPDRGFSFRYDAPLDMRFGRTSDNTAANIVNHYAEKDLADIIFHYGEEHRSRRIAAALVRKRPVLTTGELAAIVSNALGKNRGRIHPATRTFQALRIAVNRELDNVLEGVREGVKLLKPGGRIAVIAYHSLEDRIVKNYFRNEASQGRYSSHTTVDECKHTSKLRLVTKKVIKPFRSEVEANVRSRSARLRIAERI